MRGDLKKIAQYRKPSGDAFASVVRSFGEANSRLQALAIEVVGRAVEIQTQFVGKAYDTYISEVSKLGRTFFVLARPQAANLNEKRLPIERSAIPQGDALPPRPCPPNARQDPSRRGTFSLAPRDRRRRKERPVLSVAKKARGVLRESKRALAKAS